jgi:hypothetical protein
MKLSKFKLIIFLISFLSLNSAEQNANNRYNSLQSDFEPGQQITIENDTDDIIEIFGTIFFIDNMGNRELMLEGMKLESKKLITIDLCDIIKITSWDFSKEKLTYFFVTNMKKWECSNNIKLEIGARYKVTHQYENGSMRLKIKKSDNE